MTQTCASIQHGLTHVHLCWLRLGHAGAHGCVCYMVWAGARITNAGPIEIPGPPGEIVNASSDLVGSIPGRIW